ncbi:3-hydroxy-5-phosphonooxypentane-2,4-dione thiolase [Escherichia coli]|nr:3-hydroxy-5-phosphonooxypentane-2,4-dione thiolase [Escherichia coli]
MRIRYGWELALAALLVIEIVAFGAINPRMLDLNMLLFSTSDFICIGIVALPLTMVIVSGGIDISFGSTIGLCAIALGVLFQSGVPMPLAILLTLLLGALCGLINAGLIIYRPVVLRASGANSILAELSNEAVALSMDDAVRLNSCAVAAQVYIGSEYEHQSIKNIIQLVDAGMKVGMPTMAVTGVGKDMVRDQRYFSLATRIAAEMGAQIIKTYYVEKGFERIVAGCPVPIVIAGGKKLPEREALEMCWQAIDQGASGVDMGRNIFQSDHPVAMMKAVQAVVHHNETADRAYELYLSEKQ